MYSKQLICVQRLCRIEIISKLFIRYCILDEIFLMKPEDYKFMRNDSVKIPGVQDENDFEDTREAMDIMLMSSEEQIGESVNLLDHGSVTPSRNTRISCIYDKHSEETRADIPRFMPV